MTAAARVALVGSAAAQPASWAAGETVDEAVAMVGRLLDPAFLAEAGWDAVGRLLCPPPEHPLLGRPVCRAPGCQATAFGRARVCQRCQRRLARAGLGPDAVCELPEPPCQPPSRCAVTGCPRPWKTSGDRLCLAHLRQQREVLKVPLEAFLALPQARPLPSCGPCQVPACTRERVGASGSYCDAHQQRFRAATRAVPGLDEAAWRAAQPAIAQYGQVSLHGLAPLVAAQLLVGLQQRTRSSTRTSEKALRSVCEKLRLHHVTTIIPASGEVSLPGLDRNAGTLLASLARHARRALLDPETEKAKDVWDLAAFGRPGGTLPFTGISQPWLREAAKRWAVEELPRRRGRGLGGSLRSCVHSLARLSEVPNIAGVKEASGNMSQIAEVCNVVPEHFLVFSGDDSITLPVIALGGVGTKPWRSQEAEQALVGATLSESSFRNAAEAALQGARPQSQNGFKIELAKRCLTHALNLATQTV